LLPVVSLDVLPADVPAEYAPQMASACTEALTEGSCVLASTLPESVQPDRVALVLWRGEDYREVTVRVGRGNGQWAARSLSFAEADSLPERWITVGLTVATLVGESAPALPARPALRVPAKPAKKQAEVASTPRFDAALGLLGGPGWNEGGPQLGGWVAAGFRLPTTPFVFHAFGSYARSQGPDTASSSARTLWLTAGVSGGAAGALRALDLRASGALELAFRKVRAEFNGQSASDEEVPVRVRLLVSYPAESRAALTAGAILRLPPLGSEDSDTNHLRGPRVALELLAGVEVRL
jgi:hypothetical protein